MRLAGAETAGDDETLSRLLRRRCRAAPLQPSQKPFADFALTGAEQPDPGPVRHTGPPGFDGAPLFHHAPRSAERPVGTECGSAGRSRWSPCRYKKTTYKQNKHPKT